MGGDSRIGKCCCGVPVITTTSANLLSHSTGILHPGAIVTLSSLWGDALPGDITFTDQSALGYPYYFTVPLALDGHHWLASPRTTLNSISVGDYTNWYLVVNSEAPLYDTAFKVALGWHLTGVVSISAIWAEFILTSTYTSNPTLYEIGIPQDAKVFWYDSGSYVDENSAIAIVFYDATWAATSGYNAYMYSTALYGSSAANIGETESGRDPSTNWGGTTTPWVVATMSIKDYFAMIHAL